ncbi:MAG: SDR family oxidoreductase [Pseudomonadota bacterium]
MKLVIFGATGQVGRHLVAQALALGHEVTAFVRDPDKLGRSDPRLRAAQGDVLDPEAVARAVQGQDAVLNALGMPLMNQQEVRARGTRNIVGAMVRKGVGRIVCLSALGTGESRALLPVRYRWFLAPIFMRWLYADHEQQERTVKSSPLDWVIVRPGNFVKGPPRGRYCHGDGAIGAKLSLKIAPADVAQFMLAQLNDDGYLRQAPALSY